MSDAKKTKAQLINELEMLRRRVSRLQKCEGNRKRAEEALLDSERRFRDISENALEWIWEVDAKGKYTYASPVVEKVLGYKPREILKKHFYDLFHPEDREELKKAALGVFAKRKPFREFINRNLHKNGKTVWLSTSGVPVFNEQGNLVGYRGVDTDTTERKLAEQQILGTREFYENLVGNAGDAILSTTPEGLVTSWNRGAERLYGYTEREALGRDVRELLAPSNKVAEVTRMVNASAAGKEIVRVDTVRLRKDRSAVEVEVTNSPIRDRDGNVIGASGIHKDISERKRLERDILETKGYLEDLVGSAGDAVLGVKPDGTIITWNTGAEEIFGFSREEALGKNIRIIARDDTLADMEQVMTRVQLGQVIRNYETVRYRKDGSPVEINLTNSPIIDARGNVIGLCGIYKDVTERNRTEREVSETKEFLENLIVTAGDAIICADRAGTITVWNPAAERLYGYTRKEALGQSFLSLIVPDEKKDEANELHKALDQGQVTQDFETQRRRKDGSLVWVSISHAPLFLRDGTHSGNIGIHKDITGRKRAEAEIIQISEYYQTLVGSAGDAIVAVDLELKVTVWNIGAERIFGYSQQEALEQHLPALIGGMDKSDEVAERGHCSMNGLSQGSYEARRYRKDGTEVWLFVTTTPLRDADGKLIGVLSIHKDITEEKRIRVHLMQSEKMSSLGELISGVAHELNNPLTSVIAFSQLSLLQSDLSAKVRGNLEKATSEAERASKIVQNLLTFARQRKPEKRAISINDLLRRTLDLRAYQLRVNNIGVVEELDAELPDTIADPYQLQQVFLNLVTNAEQAMMEANGRGKLIVRTSQWQDAEQKPWIRVEIEDEGPGIPEEHLSRIFDPFFTTKQEGKGTGLGLSTCYGIMQQHGGRISVQNKPDQGANFITDLPLALDEVQITEEEGPREVAASFGKSVIIVDDEEFILEVLSQFLEQSGHRVETALSGRTATRMLKGKDYDLIIMDYKMPDLGGRELYLWLKDQKPHLVGKVLLVTGDTVSLETQAFLDETKLPHLAKPFGVRGARALINRLLSSEQDKRG